MKLIVVNELIEEEAWITTDKNKLNSILTNLIKNAIKFTEKGEIIIGCKINHDLIEFYVKDTGIGVPSAKQEAIFNRFEQADIDDKQALEGFGLGLAIVKSYVDLLNGNIWIESEEDKGSTFSFKIPYQQVKSEMSITQNNNQRIKEEALNLNILIVEDNPTSLLYLTTILKSISTNIHIATDGLEAVDICKNNPHIDLILMDFKLPGINGLEATRMIRKFNKKIIIIAQTAHVLEGDRENSIEAGCDDYISKPIEKDLLLELIRKHLKIN